jgi:hypothetical protein
LFCLLVITKSRFLVEMSYKSIDVPIELLTLFFHGNSAGPWARSICRSR